jgi:PqqD family protein of HPr-rel-A system
MPHGDTWTRDRQDELHWRRWGQVCFVYHTASGQTHFLNELGARILEVIDEAPRSVDEIVDLLTSRYEIERDQALHDSVRNVVQTMDKLGLISPYDS